MGKHVDRATDGSQWKKVSAHFAARIDDTYAYIYERKTGRQIAWVLVSDIVPLHQNKEFIALVIMKYVLYLKGGISMEYKASSLIEVTLNHGVAALMDKRTGQIIAQLRYNPSVSPMETMAFLSAVIRDYEKYLKLIEKFYKG